MASFTSSILRPSAQSDPGTIDGVNWGSPTGPQRLHKTNTGTDIAIFDEEDGRLWQGCFDDDQIPAGATIDAIELIGGPDSSDGTTGSLYHSAGADADEVSVFALYMYNGSSYSSKTTITITDDMYQVSGSTVNVGHQNLGTTEGYVTDNEGNVTSAGFRILVPAGTHGLSWSVNDQNNFGFLIGVEQETGSPVALASNGIGLRAYYSGVDSHGEDPVVTGFQKSVIGKSTYSKILGIDVTGLTKVIGVE